MNVTLQQLSDEQFKRHVMSVANEMIRRKIDGFEVADKYLQEIMLSYQYPIPTRKDRLYPMEESEPLILKV